MGPKGNHIHLYEKIDVLLKKTSPKACTDLLFQRDIHGRIEQLFNESQNLIQTFVAIPSRAIAQNSWPLEQKRFLMKKWDEHTNGHTDGLVKLAMAEVNEHLAGLGVYPGNVHPSIVIPLLKIYCGLVNILRFLEDEEVRDLPGMEDLLDTRHMTN